MNIQGVVQQLNNLVSNIQNGETIKQSAQTSSEGVEAKAATASSTPSDVKMAGQEAINSLLKELSDKLGTAQKNLDSMPQGLKDAIRQLFTNKTAMMDLGDGLSNLLQGQKDVAVNLNKLADTLASVAEFLNDAAQPEEAGTKETLPKFRMPEQPSMPVTKEAVAEKLDAQLIKSLLESIAAKDGAAIVKELQILGKEITEEPLPEGKQAQPDKDASAQMPKEAATQAPKDAAAPQQAQTTAKGEPLPGEGKTASSQTAGQPAAKESAPQQGETAKPLPAEQAPKTITADHAPKAPPGEQQPKPSAGESAPPQQAQTAPREHGTTINSNNARQPVLSQDGKEQTAKGETKNLEGKNPNLEFFRNATVVKGLAEVVGKNSLTELIDILKNSADKTAAPKDGAPAQQTAGGKEAPAEPATQPKQDNSLLNMARAHMPPSGKELPQPTTKDIARFMDTMQRAGLELQKESAQRPEVARALQTLSSRPEDLSGSEKAMLHSLIANVIKDTFKKPEEFSLLEKALHKLTGKEGSLLDSEGSDLETFNKLLKNSESLQYSKQQVDSWAHSLRDIAAGMARTTQMPSERNAQHIQSSFMFYLAPDGQEKNQPVYVNIYHDKEGSGGANGAKNPETWLRINAAPEFTGAVTAIFHLYQENLLDVRVVFENPEGMKEFSRFVPNIQDALVASNMKLNSIMVV